MSDYSQKIEKISSAVYFVTSFFDEKEPLKWRLRSLALDLTSEKIKDKSNVSKEISQLFSIAKNAGLISESNHDIIAGELSKLERSSEKSLYQLLLEESKTEERISPPVKREEFIKDKSLEPEVKSFPRERPLEPQSKPLKEFGKVSVKKNTRQSTIISLLKRKKEIMIKDVLPLISGCSEKTIQRELLAMVNAGIIKKEGEKRWSRYSLV